jgi:RimJ/RimL family protein N-acetyltransferase
MELTGPVRDQQPGPPALRPITIPGQDVTLRPPQPDDAEELYAGSHTDPDSVWTYLGYGPWQDLEAFRAWFDERAKSPDPLWFTVVDNRTQRPIGMVTMMSYEPNNRTVELGHIWYVTAAQGTTANTEATYLLLRHLFTDYRARRVEWKCNALNDRSRAAALRLGFEFEGVFRQHMIVKGRNRDTAWYAMTDGDWPQVSARLEEWLYQLERDASGKPLRSLTEIGAGNQAID